MMKTFPADVGALDAVTAYVTDAMRKGRRRQNPQLLAEYELLLEELTVKLTENAPPHAEITVEILHRFGGTDIKIGCPGSIVRLDASDRDDIGGQILEEFSDRLSQSYAAGTNYVTFAAYTSSDVALTRCVLSMLLAFVAYGLLRFFCSGEQIAWLCGNVLYPTVQIFTRFLSTVSMPVAFFSLAWFVVTIRQKIESNRKIRRIFIRYFLSSVTALLLGALCAYFYIRCGLHMDLTAYRTGNENFMGETVAAFFANLVPDNIIEPFLLTNPLPMLLLAVLLGTTVSRYFGEDGKTAQKGLASINGLFCGMMNIVYDTIPFFLFAAELKKLSENGITLSGSSLFRILFFLPPMLLLIGIYLVRLAIAGIPPRRFLKEYGDVILENLKIGSNIQALSYNKRILRRKTKIPASLLSEELKIGTLMNMDGNCLMISMGILLCMSYAEIPLTLTLGVGLAIITVLFSVGAPNQPGSFLLSMLVLMQYVGISGMLCIDILVIEALLGKFYSFLNALGDIVTILVEAQTQEKPKTN